MLEEQHNVGPGEGCADFRLIPVTRRRIVTAAALLVARPEIFRDFQRFRMPNGAAKDRNPYRKVLRKLY